MLEDILMLLTEERSLMKFLLISLRYSKSITILSIVTKRLIKSQKRSSLNSTGLFLLTTKTIPFSVLWSEDAGVLEMMLHQLPILKVGLVARMMP